MPVFPTSTMPQLFHKHYFEVEAQTHYELGRQLGQLFNKDSVQAIRQEQKQGSWQKKTFRAKSYLDVTQKIFPHFVEELRGYAQGANVSFEDLWALNMEDELDDVKVNKCTTIITNNGKLIAHNEDWYADMKDTVYVVKKTVGGLTIFELFYTNTLGGNAISINSHGYIQAINSLMHTDHQVGIPRNIIARWLSETSSPETAFQWLTTFPRSTGYNHNILNIEGKIWNIECSGLAQEMSQPSSPFIHTNHFLSKLQRFEKEDDDTGSYHRYQCALAKIKKHMSVYELKNMMSKLSKGKKIGLFNDHTIARMLIDLVSMKGYVWLRREAEKGWVKYDLSFAKWRSFKEQKHHSFRL